MKFFIIININLTCKRFHSIQKKAFLFSSIWQGTEYTWGLIRKNGLLVCFESYQGISSIPPPPPSTHTGRVDRNVNTLLIVNIDPICKG